MRHIWMLILRISVLFGIIWIAVQFYDFIKPSFHGLEVDGHYYVYHIPDSIKREVWKINDVEARENVKRFSEVNSLYVFSLRNQTDKEISGINLDVPFEGIFQITRNERVILSSKYDRKIPVGSLQPADDINVIVWTDSWTTVPKGRFDKRYRVHYPGDTSYVDFPMEVRGVMATVIDYGIANLFILLSVLLLVLTSFTIIIMLLLRKE